MVLGAELWEPGPLSARLIAEDYNVVPIDH
jgi:hypothetical protein